MGKILFSIIIPSYNSALFIRRCLDSLLKQYLQLIIPQYFISNKSGIWSLSLIVHSKG